MLMYRFLIEQFKNMDQAIWPLLAFTVKLTIQSTIAHDRSDKFRDCKAYRLRNFTDLDKMKGFEIYATGTSAFLLTSCSVIYIYL